LGPESQVYIYGKLTSDPFIMKKPMMGLQGTGISNFMLFESYARIFYEKRESIRTQFSSLLKNELTTSASKNVKLEEVPAAWEES
jgi:hypothetical protein